MMGRPPRARSTSPLTRLASIKFPSRWTDPATGRERVEMAHFALGPGPCGKTVESLHEFRDREGFRILQRHTDGSCKAFTYPWSQIVGRIETEIETA